MEYLHTEKIDFETFKRSTIYTGIRKNSYEERLVKRLIATGELLVPLHYILESSQTKKAIQTLKDKGIIKVIDSDLIKEVVCGESVKSFSKCNIAVFLPLYLRKRELAVSGDVYKREHYNYCIKIIETRLNRMRDGKEIQV